MRTEPAWTAYPYQAALSWIATFIIAAIVVLAANCTAAPVQASQFYLEGGIGAAFFRPTVDDGTWRQDGVQTPNFRLADHAWTVGVGYRINERWSIQGHRFDWGSAAVKSRFASDEDYYGGACATSCPTAHYKVMDRMFGYDLTVTRHFPLQNTKWEPYLKGGAAVAFHELKWTKPDSSELGPTRLHGAIPMLVIGGGLSYKNFFVDTSFYTGTLSMNGGCIGGGQYDCGYPLSKQVVVTTVGIKIPLGS